MAEDGITVSIVIPVFNGLNTLSRTLDSVARQTAYVSRTVLVIDGGSEIWATVEMLKQREFQCESVIVVVHSNNLGLAAAYNSGLKHVDTELVVFVHQDMILDANDTLHQLLEPFQDRDVAAVGHRSKCPAKQEAKSLNLPLALLLSPSCYRNAAGWNGQLDAARCILLARVGGFDEDRFATAGEDGDIVVKLRRVGRVVTSRASGTHMDKGRSTTWRRYFGKRYQYAEALGALFALHGRDCGSAISMSWRAILGFLLPLALLLTLFDPLGFLALVALCLPFARVAGAAAALKGNVFLVFPGLLAEVLSAPLSAAGFAVGFARRQAVYRTTKNSRSRDISVVETLVLK